MKAVYGFRRSPCLWGEHRDRIIEEMKVKVQEEEGGREGTEIDSVGV